MKRHKNILLTGGTGFIGTSLTARLVNCGYKVYVLSRSPAKYINTGSCCYIGSLELLDGITIDAVFNLAGEPLAAKRWNKHRKEEFLSSRIQSTRQLLLYFKKRQQPPRVFISGSAIGYYGPSDDQYLNEDTKSGSGFAAELCLQWEQQAQALKSLGSRLCIARIGIVLGSKGGAFTEMRRSFDYKVASRLGSGQQWLSWIHLEDMVGSLIFLLENEQSEGVFNCTAPKPVTNEDFTFSMKKISHAKIDVPIPALALRVLVGEMADELLLVGQRVVPTRLLSSGFHFKHTAIDSAIKDIY